MYRRTAVLLALALLATPLMGCERKQAIFNPALAGDFFPLKPNAVWTYRISSKSQRTTYVVTDKVIGLKYVPSLNVTGQVVEEFYNLDRGGTRPIVYVVKNGYLYRLSGMEYSKQNIEAPAWGRSEEGAFMPQRLVPDLSWNSKNLPFGDMPGAFDISQEHRTVFETDDVTVPAGRFQGCIRIDTQAVYEGGTYAKSGGKLRLTYRDWYAPNVGLIKTVALEGGPRGPELERVELMRYMPPASGAGARPASALPPSSGQAQSQSK